MSSLLSSKLVNQPHIDSGVQYPAVIPTDLWNPRISGYKSRQVSINSTQDWAVHDNMDDYVIA